MLKIKADTEDKKKILHFEKFTNRMRRLQAKTNSMRCISTRGCSFCGMGETIRKTTNRAEYLSWNFVRDLLVCECKFSAGTKRSEVR